MKPAGQTTNGWGCVFAAALMVATASSVFYARGSGSHSGIGYWLFLPVVALVAAFATVAAIMAPLMLYVWVRSRLGMSGPYTLARAKKASGGEGKLSYYGPVTIWRSGPIDTFSMLTQQLELARTRLAGVTGRETVLFQPLRIYFFDQLEAYVTFHKQFFAGPPSSICASQGRPVTMAVMCGEPLPYVLQEIDSAARHLFCFYCLDQVFSFELPLWLQLALVNVACEGEDSDGISRLDRKVCLWLRDGAEFDAGELFEPTGKALRAQGRNVSDLDSFSKVLEFACQSHSVGEYLFGSGSTDDRRERFKAFIAKFDSSTDQSEQFQHHFGIGFEQLLLDWRAWAQERVVAPHHRPPPGLRDSLTDRVIPLVENAQAKLSDRIWAVRAMGSRFRARCRPLD